MGTYSWRMSSIEWPSVRHGGIQVELAGKTLLYFGDGSSLHRPDGTPVRDAVSVDPSMHASIQLPRLFDIVWIEGPMAPIATPESCRAVLHSAVQHLSPDGLLVAVLDQLDSRRNAQLVQMCPDFALERVELSRYLETAALFRRQSERVTVHDLLTNARSRIRRLDPQELYEAMNSDLPPTILDTRTHTDRERFGVIPGAFHVPRTVLEWQLDPSNGYRNPAVTSMDQTLVVVCNGGYSSSLAAANLAVLGFTDVCDLVGGHRAWRESGLPIEAPDHSSLDF